MNFALRHFSFRTRQCLFVSLALLATHTLLHADTAGVNTDIEAVGAIAGGSEDGKVPTWTGGLDMKKSSQLTKVGGHHIDPFANEPPLFIIDINNYKDHQDYLTPGLIAMLKAYPATFTIPVYPSHRTTAYPDWYYENTRNAKPAATLAKNGTSINNIVKGVNFPHPKNGLEAIWNHLTRWRGRFFIRNMAAYDVCALMAYKNLTLEEATTEVIRKQTEIGGKGGLIALDKDGHVSMPFNTAGMFRGYITEKGEIYIAIYAD